MWLKLSYLFPLLQDYKKNHSRDATEEQMAATLAMSDLNGDGKISNIEAMQAAVKGL